jgi:tetratricopeptide (TPR) repeat protein
MLDAALAGPPAGDPADASRRARLLRGRADLDRREMRYAVAEAQLAEARKIAMAVDDADAVDEIDITWGLGRLEQGKWDDAIRAFEQAFDRAVARAGSESVQAQATFYRGVVDEWRGRFPEALVRLRDARARFAELGDRNREGIAASDLGAALFAAGYDDEARAVFADALAICRELGAPRREAMVLVKVATGAFSAGRLDEAEAAWTRAQRLHAEVGNRRELAIAIGNLGWLAEEQGRVGEAHQKLAEALRLHRAMGNRRSEGVAVGNLALWTLAWGPAGEGPGDPRAAVTGLEASVRVLDDVGDPRGAGYFRSWLGAARAAVGDRAGAEADLAAASVQLAVVPHPAMMAVHAVLRAWAEALSGDVTAAARVVTDVANDAARSAEVRHAIRVMKRSLSAR